MGIISSDVVLQLLFEMLLCYLFEASAALLFEKQVHGLVHLWFVKKRRKGKTRVISFPAGKEEIMPDCRRKNRRR